MTTSHSEPTRNEAFQHLEKFGICLDHYDPPLYIVEFGCTTLWAGDTSQLVDRIHERMKRDARKAS